MNPQRDFEKTLRGFRDAARWFDATTREVVSAIGLDAPALGAWTVRDLVGHTSRALTTVESYLQPSTVVIPPATATTSDYYAAVGLSRAEPEAVAERGREAGRTLGEEPASAVSALISRIVPLVEACDPEAVVVTPVGAWTLAAYLPTRVFELVVHTGDLRAAAGLDASVGLDAAAGLVAAQHSSAAVAFDAAAAPQSSAEVALDVLGLLVARSAPADAMPLLRALTGRGALPSGLSLL